MRIVDVHTHAFPDNLAGKAMKALDAATQLYKPSTDGTIGGLLSSMDKAGIQSSFVLNIATKPGQAAPIRAWSKAISSERIIPLGSIHPGSPTWQSELDGFKADGIKGLKFHALYQDFAIDDRKVFPIYEYAASAGMFIIFHSGGDIAFPGSRLSSVDKIAAVARDFPSLKVVAAHFGGWRVWTEVREHLCGKDVFFDTSFIHEVDERLRDDILSHHDRNRFLFGTDSPWSDQKAQVEYMRDLKVIDQDFKDRIFSMNMDSFLSC